VYKPARGRYRRAPDGSSHDPRNRSTTVKTNLTITAAKVLTVAAFLAALGAPKKW
jgi:hypothetical protein